MESTTWLRFDKVGPPPIKPLTICPDSIPVPYFFKPLLAYGLHLGKYGLKGYFHCSKSYCFNNRLEGLVWHIKIYSIFSKMWARIPRA